MKVNLFIFNFKLMIKGKIIRYLNKIILFIIWICCIDFIFGLALKKLFCSQISGPDYRTMYVLNRCNEDLLIFGSSRASHHYVPEVLSNELKMSVYNAGRDGQSILYHNAVLKAILKHHIPKIIILDLNYSEFFHDRSSYDRLTFLLPYYYDYKSINEVLDKRNRFEPIKLLSHIYPYNSTFLSSIAFTFNIKHPLIQQKALDYNGYVPLKGEISDQFEVNTIHFRNEKIDTIKFNCYKDFINQCDLNNIELFICFSPSFDNVFYSDIQIFNELSMRSNFIDFSNNKDFIGKTKLFRDRSHLNNEGAVFFSKCLVTKILKQHSTFN
jgi:hypothetical protein